MTTQSFLTSIAANALGADFQQELRSQYQRRAKEDSIDTLEAEYAAAKAFLQSALSVGKQAKLSAYEDLCAKIREFSGRFGFEAGLFCGFKQFFTADNAEDGGFYAHVENEIASMPNMTRHTENYENIRQRNALLDALHKEEDCAVSEGLLSMDCTWNQRTYSASIHGFYCGYLGAMQIIDNVNKSQGGSLQMTAKRLAMEHYFGYRKDKG